MKSITKLQDISSRIEHLVSSANWIAREAVHTDTSICQTGTLIEVLADEIREKIFDLVQDLEVQIESNKTTENIH